MKWIEPSAVTMICDDCDARAPADRLTVTIAQSTRGGEVQAGRADRLIMPKGWVEGRARPAGKPVLSAAGLVQVDPFADSAETVATKTGIEQPVIRCAACTVKAHDRGTLEGAGLHVVTGGAS